MKVGRNDPCPCGSGIKYKKCCYLHPRITTGNLPIEAVNKLKDIQAHETERMSLYGNVRPIIHADNNGYKFVAVGSRVHYSKNWKTFPDFLENNLAGSLGKEWGDAQLKLPLESRHQIMKWYDGMCRFKQKQKPNKEGLYEVIPNGTFSAYIHLAYDLYILKDNQALQEEIIRRLKISDQFQGARYELFVTATCIRAGFSIVFENEKDGSTKHPEFMATHKETGQRIAVEAKSRHRIGILGYQEGYTHNGPIRLDVTSLINKALKKAGDFPFVVFVDTNLPPEVANRIYENNNVSEAFKKTMDNVQKADNDKDLFNMIVFTNHPHHYGEENDLDPKSNVQSVYSLKPVNIPINEQSILNLREAALQYNNIPNEFPKEFN